MADNVGGLDYTLNVVGNFEAKLAEFENRVNALQKKTTQAASAGGARKGGKTIDQRRDDAVKKRAQREDVADVKRRNKLEQDRVRNILNASKRARAVEKGFEKERLAAALRYNKEVTQGADRARAQTTKTLRQDILARDKASKAEAVAAQKAAKFNNISAVATERNVSANRELAIKKAQILQLQTSQNISQRKAADLVGITSTQAKQLGLNMFDAQHAASQFLFTFRRLVGILAIFTLARKLAQAIGSAVREMSDFNAELETAEIGIASIVASLGQIRDAQGELVTGADAFQASLAASGNIINQLKKDAIGSIATFEALTKAFQVAVGPGLAAGLDLEQIRVLSKRLAEGAITLGVPLNQLSEEIRSLLQGTATARNTRIAVLFGGAKEANEAVRNAKEQGNLFEVLEEKLRGVAQGADAASLSMNVLKSDLQDAVQLLLAEGGIEQFEQLKESILAFRNAITDIDVAGNIIFSPEALGIVQEVAGTLASITQSFRDLTDTSSALATVRNIIGAIGDVLRGVAPLATALFQGILDGVNTLLAPVRLLLRSFRGIATTLGLDKLNKNLLQAVKFVTQVTVGLFLWKKTLLFIQGLLSLKGILGAHKAILTAVLLTASVLKGQGVALLSINGLTAIWSVLMGDIAVKTALATGGLTLLFGVLAAVVVKMGLIDRLTNSFNNELSEADKAAISLEGSISSAGDATAEGARSAKEWVTALREAKLAADIAEGLQGVEGLSKDILAIIQEETKEYENRNRVALKNLETTKKQKQEAELVADAIKDGTKALKAGDLTAEEIFSLPPELLDQVTRVRSVFDTPDPLPALTARVGDTAQAKRESEVLRLAQQQKEIEESLADERRKSNELIKERIRLVLAENSFLEERKNLEVAELQTATAKAATSRLNISVSSLIIAKAETAELEAQIALNEKTRKVEQKRLTDRIDGLKAQLDFTTVTEADLVKLATLENQRTRAIELATASREKDLALMKRQSEELRIQEGLVKGDVGIVVTEGFAAFARELPSLGEQVAETITGALSDLAGTVASVFKDAIDPRTDADLETAFGEFFLNLAGQFVEALTSQLIAKTIGAFGLGSQEDVAVNALTAATQAQTVATQANTIALQTPQVGVPGTPGFVGPPAPASTGASEAASKAGGFLGGVANVSPILLAILLPIIIALITQAFKKGGQVKGYASGGRIAGDIPRPSSIPASDTVPAWLTPGEGILNVNAMKSIGVSALDFMNKYGRMPSTFAPAAFSMGGMARGVQSFANGGSVQRATQQGSTVRQDKTIVTPILVASENNMEQFVSGGRRSFNRDVNKAPRIGDPNQSRGW